MSEKNLRGMFALADAVDRREGLVAYQRYHQVMRDLSDMYSTPLERVVAAFCALSPNNDYVGNLRSCASVLRGCAEGWPVEQIEVTTYRHCLIRAHRYVMGHGQFLDEAKGLKIRSFYMNVLRPDDHRFVTVDGHMVAAWRGQALTMKQAIPKAGEYRAIEYATKRAAFESFILPNQYQAIVWFVRKRVFNIKVGKALQYDLLAPEDLDMWQTYRDVSKIKPLPRRGGSNG